MTGRLRYAGAMALCVVAFAACAEEESELPATPADTSPSPEAGPVTADTAADSTVVGDPPTRVPGPLSSPPRTWTTQTTEVNRPATTGTLEDVRMATHAGFDRTVFTFGGDMPGYHVEYVDRPQYTCGAGEAVDLDGDAWLLVRMRPAQAHTDAGEATIGQRRRRPGFPVLREAMMTCDFEGDVSWVLGVASPGGYQMAELDKPARLVVDVRN